VLKRTEGLQALEHGVLNGVFRVVSITDDRPRVRYRCRQMRREQSIKLDCGIR
jgi:hypothetical protein